LPFLISGIYDTDPRRPGFFSRWIEAEEPFGPCDSLDKVEWIMALEEELPGLDIPDDLASRTDRTTFRDIVERRAKHRRWRA